MEEHMSAHPFVVALNEMYESYNGQWPPRPSFENWPPSFMAYQQIADEMPDKLVEFNEAEVFRKWMQEELEYKVDLEMVLQEVEDRLSHGSNILLGFCAPLAFLANAFRWGTVPPTDQERMRKTLEFPEKLWIPFEKINNFYGLVQRGNAFTLMFANCIYDDDDTPVDMRFYFNADPEIMKTEKNFFLSFLHMEKTWKPALHMMAEYLTLTEHARRSHDNAKTMLERRVQLLKDMRKSLVGVSRVFHSYMKDTVVSVEHWADYVQSMPAWNVNGVDGGASGGESMTFHSLDEFLGTLGKGIIFKGGMKKRLGTPFLYRNCMEALADDSRHYRFDSFLDLPENADPLQKAKDDLISMLYTWRLFHTKVAPRYLANSRMTSGGSVDKVIVTGETLAQRGEEELRERARETANFLSPERRPKSMKGQAGIGTTTNEVPLSSFGSKSWDVITHVIQKLFSWVW